MVTGTGCEAMEGEWGLRERGKGKRSGRNWEECLGSQRQMLGINDTQRARATCPFPRATEAAPTLFFSAVKGRINV